MQVCNSGEINSRKIGHLVAAYVKKMQASRQKWKCWQDHHLIS